MSSEFDVSVADSEVDDVGDIIGIINSSKVVVEDDIVCLLVQDRAVCDPFLGVCE